MSTPAATSPPMSFRSTRRSIPTPSRRCMTRCSAPAASPRRPSACARATRRSPTPASSPSTSKALTGVVRVWPVTVGETGRAAFLGPIAVAERRRGNGVAFKLMERAIGVCREQGYAAVILVGDLDYYERFGFKPSDGALPAAGPGRPEARADPRPVGAARRKLSGMLGVPAVGRRPQRPSRRHASIMKAHASSMPTTPGSSVVAFGGADGVGFAAAEAVPVVGRRRCRVRRHAACAACRACRRRRAGTRRRASPRPAAGPCRWWRAGRDTRAGGSGRAG